MRVDGDGVRTFESRPARHLGWLIAAALGVPIAATLVAIVAIRQGAVRARPGTLPPTVPRVVSGDIPAIAPATLPPAAQGAPALAAVAAPPGARQHVVPHRTQRGAAAAAGAGAAAPDTPNIDARDAIPALIAAGEQGGITVFPLPGTKPIKRGLIVPDDFPLPEGYVRHYQTTDDGEQLPAILMFHPDYDFVNDRGEPIVVPPDRVVPPDLAPPGLPDKMLDVPEKPHESRLP